MAPVRGADERPAGEKRTAGQADLREGGLDVLLRRRDEHAGFANLRHVRDDEVRVDGLDVDALALDLGAERGVEGCQEGLGCSVRREHGRDDGDTGEGGTRENQTAATGKSVQRLLRYVWGDTY